MTATRTDIHRPSAIRPEDYQYIGCLPHVANGDPFAEMAAAEQRADTLAMIREHGWKWSNHEHGGNCHICGAHCLFRVAFLHEPTARVIVCGLDCAEKMEHGDAAQFRLAKRNWDAAREAAAGKYKAMAYLGDRGLSAVWAYAYGWIDGNRPKQCDILRDLLGSLIRYGSWSDKQEAFARRLAGEVPNVKQAEADRLAQRAAEHAAAAPAPTGRCTITGEVLSVREPEQFAQYPQWKMLVRDDRGFKVWSSIPAALGTDLRGTRVQFTATLEPSSDDVKFAFAKRPTKAVALA